MKKNFLLIILLSLVSCSTKEIDYTGKNIFPPETPTQFKASPGNKIVTLSWLNPASFAYVEIWRQEGTVPSEPGNGKRVYRGTAQDYIDTGLNGGKTYFYTLFSFNQEDTPSAGISQNATPYVVDSALNFKLLLEITGIRLNWNKPEMDLDFSGIKILRGISEYALSPDPNLVNGGGSFELIYEGDGSDYFDGTKTSLLDTKYFTSDVTYYYYIFAYDKDNRYNPEPTIDRVYSPTRLGQFVLGQNKLAKIEFLSYY